MANRSTPLLFKAFMELTEVHSSKVALRRATVANLRHVGSCGTLPLRRSSLQLSPAGPMVTPSCSFINLAAPIITRRMEYNESRTVGYTPEQMYNLVVGIDQYKEFVPWCTKSRVMKGQKGDIRAEVEIGFPPLLERYTSEITTVPNHQVRALCSDGSLFRHLETIWRFGPGTKGQAESCKVDFYVSFEFKSLLHSQLANLFFDEVVKQMVNSFEKRAATLYRTHQEAPLRRRST